jgi:hypothetical protein
MALCHASMPCSGRPHSKQNSFRVHKPCELRIWIHSSFWVRAWGWTCRVNEYVCLLPYARRAHGARVRWLCLSVRNPNPLFSLGKFLISDKKNFVIFYWPLKIFNFRIGHEVKIIFLIDHAIAKVEEQISFFLWQHFLCLTFLLTMKFDNMLFKI